MQASVYPKARATPEATSPLLSTCVPIGSAGGLRFGGGSSVSKLASDVRSAATSALVREIPRSGIRSAARDAGEDMHDALQRICGSIQPRLVEAAAASAMLTCKRDRGCSPRKRRSPGTSSKCRTPPPSMSTETLGPMDATGIARQFRPQCANQVTQVNTLLCVQTDQG